VVAADDQAASVGVLGAISVYAADRHDEIDLLLPV
jgi:hypothetical protein